jgi:hypothetical protein
MSGKRKVIENALWVSFPRQQAVDASERKT